MLNHLFTCLMVCLVRNFSQQIHTEEELNSQDISHLIQYISDHCDCITIASLAEKFNYHPSYLSKLIKKQTGVSFSEILLDARLKRAKSFLEDTDLSISDIIEELGYSNRTYFNKQFKKRYQLTPYQYRKHHQN